MQRSSIGYRLSAGVILGLMAMGTGRGAETTVGEATLHVHAAAAGPMVIPPELTGKFCEHLGANIYNGMDAQILRNPTFADVPVWTGQMNPDGLPHFYGERERIETELRHQAARYGWPEADLANLVSSRADGLAPFWCRAGAKEATKVSPDTGSHGGRAQRIELQIGGGIKQWAWLPVHRTRRYVFELWARSPDSIKLNLRVAPGEKTDLAATAVVEGLVPEWKQVTGSLTLPESAPNDVPYEVTLTAQTGGQVVLGHLFLRPADHINGADPDVIRFLKEARLPLLRWPGGNFVSAYHWSDGVGPVEQRPTLPNYAWGGVEPNTFGTDEFIAFCRAVGCEPMICVNAGTGTAKEAAQWIEYCNGPANSPMGARRAAYGHPQPYGIHHWEVGNELWGRWQAHWTTATGYVDRYVSFSRAMRKADPSIELHACGAPVLWGKNWNDTLIGGAAAELSGVTDHPLVGGDVSPSTDPLDVYRDFMHVPDLLERRWEALRKDMTQQGIREPHLAITELQMFAHLAGGRGGAEPAEPPRLTHENLVNPGTLGEALYDTLIYHAAVRLQPFVELITHSATVNHGGGLRKERERVYANPCHYANLLFANFAGAKPLKLELKTPQERAPRILPDLRQTGDDQMFGAIAALAALDPQGDLLVSLVNRGTAGPVRVLVNWDGFAAATQAQVWTLTGPVPWAANTLEKPARISPTQSRLEVSQASASFVLQPFSLVQARLPHQP